MLPQDVLSTTSVYGPFRFPYNVISTSLECYCKGGIAIQDPSHGIEWQLWKGECFRKTGKIVLTTDRNNQHVELLSVPPNTVSYFRFAFDVNMRWTAITRTDSRELTLHWFDSALGAYTSTLLGVVDSCHLCYDDSRDLTATLGHGDMILTYIKGTSLYVRYQRDRFSIERLLTSTLEPDLIVTNFGLSEQCRLQWRMRKKVLGE